jgi:hypothetical protein
MAEPDPDLIDAIYADKVRQARRMSIDERLRAGGDLFDDVCDRMRAGIRADFPQASPAEVEQELRRRLAIARRLEDRS